MELKKNRLTFGLLIDWVVGWEDIDYYQSIILSGVQEFVLENDINLICLVTGRLNSPNEWERSRNILFEFVDKNKFDGLIVLSSSISGYGTSKNILKRLGNFSDIPIVIVGELYDEYCSVSSDNRSGMRQVIDHLIEVHNCRKIAFIKGVEGSMDTEVRFQAYIESLTAHNIPFNPDLVYSGNFLHKSGSNAVKELIRKNIQFDAIASSNDNMAIGALVELHKRMGKIPDNIPITGFDDTQSSHFHAITTVHQSFLTQASTASSLLLRMIKGEKVPLKTEVPVDMVIRSSCGCIPTIVTNTFASFGECVEVPYEAQKEQIISELNEISSLIGFAENSSEQEQLFLYTQKLLDAFYAELYQKKSNQFIHAWNAMIFWMIMKNAKISFLHDLLSSIRKIILSALSDASCLVLAENLFHAARVQIIDALQRTAATVDHLSSIQTGSLELLGEDLVTNLDLNTQMDLVYKVLPELGIKKCYITLYEDPEKPLEYSRLVLAFNENERFNTGPSGISFPSRNIIPFEFFEDLSTDRFSIIVQVLNQGDDQLGLSICSFDSKISKTYEIFRYRLSVALKGSLLIEKIKNQALDLEKQVIERTSELSETNNQLLDEVSRRTSAEEQLKKALKELEFYNKQLHLQSLQDELTRLYNRRGFMELGCEYYERAKASAKGFLLIYGDMDWLKQINDSYGHAEGDFAIAKTAEILNISFRRMDIIARLGGDEFTIIVSDASPDEDKEIRERLENNFLKFNQTSNKPYKLSLTVGTAYFDPSQPCTFEDLIKKADLDLYNKKQLKKRI